MGTHCSELCHCILCPQRQIHVLLFFPTGTNQEGEINLVTPSFISSFAHFNIWNNTPWNRVHYRGQKYKDVLCLELCWKGQSMNDISANIWNQNEMTDISKRFFINRLSIFHSIHFPVFFFYMLQGFFVKGCAQVLLQGSMMKQLRAMSYFVELRLIPIDFVATLDV